MSGNNSLFRLFSENLSHNFQRFKLKLSYEGEDVKEPLYLCPISLRCYSEKDLKSGCLTLDHFPPKSLGGKGIVLTSKEVNSKDGHTSDKKLLNFFESENFKLNNGEVLGSISSEQLAFGGITAKFSLSLKEGKPKFIINSSKKNIEVLDYKGLFKNWDGGQFNVNWQQQLEIDKKAILKCAYLTAFSRIGYELLFDSNGIKKDTYGVLVNYLQDADLNIDFPVLYINEHAPIDNSPLGVINSPEEYKSIFVNLNFELNGNVFKYLVFLPHTDSVDLKPLENLKTTMLDASYSVDFKISEITMDICS